LSSEVVSPAVTCVPNVVDVEKLESLALPGGM